MNKKTIVLIALPLLYLLGKYSSVYLGDNNFIEEIVEFILKLLRGIHIDFSPTPETNDLNDLI